MVEVCLSVLYNKKPKPEVEAGVFGVEASTPTPPTPLDRTLTATMWRRMAGTGEELMQLVLPTTRLAIRVAHSTPLTGHFGRTKTIQRLLRLARHQQRSGRCLQKLCSLPEDGSGGAEPSPTYTATNNFCGRTICESCYEHSRPTTEVRKRSSL